MRTMGVLVVLASAGCLGLGPVAANGPAVEDLGAGFPITELIRSGDCRMLMIGDSITNRTQNGPLPESQSSLYWGVLRTWMPDDWVGISVPINSHFDIQTTRPDASFATTIIRSLQPRFPWERLFSYGYERLSTSPTLDALWDRGNAPVYSPVIRTRLNLAGIWSGNPWATGPLQADFVYFQTPETIGSVRIRSERAGGAQSTLGPLDPSGQPGIAVLRAPPIPAGTDDPIVTLLGGDAAYDESARPDHLIWLTTYFHRTDQTGFSLDALAVGSAKVADHLADGSYATDQHLADYLDATGKPNLYYIAMGTNDRGAIDANWQADYILLIERYAGLSRSLGVEPNFVLMPFYETQQGVSHAAAQAAADLIFEIASQGTPTVPDHHIAFVNLPYLLGNGPIDPDLLIDNFHPTRDGADLVMSLVWDAITTCHADLTGSLDPNSPDFGMPNGVVDSNDFFYYLDRFAAHDIDAADLTGSASPSDPSFGVPNLVLDANDFFYYLDMFVRGCQ